MASHHGNSHSERARMEQIITEVFAKSLHIILESRCPYVSSRNYSVEQTMSSPSSSSSSLSSIRPRDKWFNLALRDCPAALENIDFWRQSNLEPMVVDVILMQSPSHWDPMNGSPERGIVKNFSTKVQFPNIWNSEHDDLGSAEKSEMIIERWVVQYETRKSSRDSCSGSKRSSCTSSHTLYKKSMLLLRSLYLTVRLLPAYKLFRDLNSSAQIRTYNLAHRVSSFVEPFTRREETEMQRFVFAPVDTSCGRLCLSVLYHSSLSDVSSKLSTPMSPQFISDYVGSPMTDPLRRFPSLPVTQGSPSSSPFGRRHSWSYDLYRASSPSAFHSPSPSYSDSRASISKPSSYRLPPTCLPRHLPDTPRVLEKNTSFDEYWPSPNFSPSPSPSPPIYIPGNISKALLRSESAPVNIPASKLATSPSLQNKQIVPPSPPLKGTRLTTSKTDRSLGLTQTGSTVDKLFSFGKDETGKFSGVKISSDSSPQKSFSRSSSRLSFQDDFDDSEFSGPFVVDDDDMTDPGSRPSSFDQKGHQCEPHEPGGLFPLRKSHNAAVGALVCMLKKAEPLCQDLSNSRNLLQTTHPESIPNSTKEPNHTSEKLDFQHAASLSITSSGLVMSKTTADALEELRVYREMKDSLLRQGGRSYTGGT
ncbi:autophagy-related protein 13b [Cornus florida]|uniref:autophagy-related protein 13b n=1 Tax=Cornus florida TaxID=4283 RepID=UPI00289E87FD|nr:autophagy-related protein 13b [Cornus florida]